MKGFTPRSGSPQEDIDFNNYTLRQRGRMLYMSSPIATSAINTNRTKVVGTGLELKSAIDRDVLGLSAEAAKEWRRHTEQEFRLWADRKQNCDAIGLNNFADLQQLAVVCWLQSGDVFPLLKHYDPTPLNPYSLRIHMIEADRVRTPVDFGAGVIGLTTEGIAANGNHIYDGVEVDDNGMVVAYYVHSTYPFEQTLTAPDTYTRVLAYGEQTGLPNILHVMNSERCDQYRGITYLAQVIEPLLQLRRYTESELMAALVQSFFTAWIVTDTNKSEIPFNEVGSGDIAGVPSSNPMMDNLSRSPNEYEMGPGTVAHLDDGEDIKFGSPNIPTSGFNEFVSTFCKLIGAGLNLPYDVLIKEYNSSYSASRAALLDAWDDFKMRRSWLVSNFCQPVYEVWLAEAVARGRINAPGFFDDPLIRAAWCEAQWIGPVQASLDPKKEVQAAILQIQNGIKTHEQVTSEFGGGDWYDNVEQLEDENEKLAQAGGGGSDIADGSFGIGQSDKEMGTSDNEQDQD
ncbi:MAG: phage portal protein [Clostridia bacterium]|nr:phage portal protein [Clostridia bacterium]